MISYAQNGEDVVLARLFAGQPTGTWIDVGAGHPEDDSVTRHFSSLGWHGINIEPNADLWAELQAERPADINVCAAAGGAAGSTTFWVGAEDDDRFTGTVVPELKASNWGSVEVPVVRVTDVAREHDLCSVDFIKIDAEGAEASVIRGIDLSVISARALVVEAVDAQRHEPNYDPWENDLLAAGYVFALFDGINRFYCRAEDATARQALSAPANVLDGFVGIAEHRAHQTASEASTYATSLEVRLEGLDRQVSEASAYARSLEVRLEGLDRHAAMVLDEARQLCDL